MAKCVVCKKWYDGYEWTITKTGKKWLYSIRDGKWHDCPLSKKTFDYGQKRIEYTKNDYQFCNLCGRMVIKNEFLNKYPNINQITMEQHQKMFHPNGEILDDVDFMCLTEQQKQTYRSKVNKPKRTIPYDITSLIIE